MLINDKYKSKLDQILFIFCTDSIYCMVSNTQHIDCCISQYKKAKYAPSWYRLPEFSPIQNKWQFVTSSLIVRCFVRRARSERTHNTPFIISEPFCVTSWSIFNVFGCLIYEITSMFSEKGNSDNYFKQIFTASGIFYEMCLNLTDHLGVGVRRIL